MMAAIGATDTRPELTIRQGLHALGYRFRLGRSWKTDGRLLQGRPDLVFPGRRAVIFVNGCFWHGHDCSLFRWPATRPEFWRNKIAGNVARDGRVRSQLLTEGWRVLDVWECTLKGPNRLGPADVIASCADFLESADPAVQLGGSQTVTTDVSA